MKDELKNEIEILTNIILEIRRRRKDEHYEIIDTENSNKFKNLITNHIIPMVKDASSIVGRSGCSLNYYSNELAVIRDPKKRIFIQILFYPYGHSKVTLGVNAPFLQFAYSPLRENIKITEKISIKSDEGRTKIAEIEIDDFAQDKIDNYILSFLRDTIMFNS
ncbi:MAG: hypothetical protein IPJ45_07460 [Ignavibacteria bacterium]|nr:hypothetical protein [Ignavibacteria bacterium]